jgi:hypothetical protein
VLVVEVETFGQYKGAPGRQEIIQFLSTQGFRAVKLQLGEPEGGFSDVTFVNESLPYEAEAVLKSMKVG